MQKIFKTVLKTRAPLSNKLCKKLLKAISPNVYCDKFYIKYYKFC